MPIRKTTCTLHLHRNKQRVVVEPNMVIELTDDELKKINSINPSCLITVSEAEADQWVQMNKAHQDREAAAAAEAEARAKADAEAKAKAEADAKGKGKGGSKGGKDDVEL